MQSVTNVFALLLLVMTIQSAWVPGTLPNSFTSIFLKSEGFYRVPVRGSLFFYKTPWDAQTYEFCSIGNVQNISCTDYFCHLNVTQFASAKNHTMMQNFCQYCEYGARTSQNFVEFHQLVANNQCSLFAPFSNFSCGANAKPWLYERAYNVSRFTPYLCYCEQYDKLASECGAMSAFFDDFFHEGMFIFCIVFGCVMIPLLVVGIVIPECGIRCKYNKYQSSKEKFMSFFAIRMQSIYLLLISLILFVIDNAFEMVYFSRHYESIIAVMPNAAVYIFALMTLFMSYATMLILWSNVYTKTNEGSMDHGLDKKHIIATAVFYTIIILSLFSTFVVLVILGRSPLFLIAYVMALLIAICFFLVFPMGFTLYGCLILSFRNKLSATSVNTKITLFMILTNITFFLLVIICVPMLFTFVLGWDLLGRVFASFRYVITFSVPIVLVPPMFFILFVSRRFKAFYTGQAKI